MPREKPTDPEVVSDALPWAHQTRDPEDSSLQKHVQDSDGLDVPGCYHTIPAPVD